MLSSAEVGTLITALGCGIGRDEFDPDKLRYHRVIIMTDADVDGSHIRTLLLTFFYRQMPELIERGHIYIGQPPLYKIKQGKQEHYLKDDAELNEYLLARALDNAALVFDPAAPPLQGETLENLMREYMAADAAVTRLGNRHDPLFLGNLIDSEEFSTKWQAKRVGQWCEKIVQRMNEQSPPSISYGLSAEKADPGFDLVLERTAHGVTEQRRIRRDFFHSPEYRLIGSVARTLFGFMQAGAEVRRGKSRAGSGQLPGSLRLANERKPQGAHHPALQGTG